MVMTVNDKGLVEPRPVQVGEWTGEEWIISGGLKQGDKVIVDGFFKAPPGTPVKMSELASKDAETSEKGTPAGTGGSR
jgi:membrane fusion protein (multidrug efflux system)